MKTEEEGRALDTQDKECVVFENAGQRIYGIIHRPINVGGTTAAVVICHGFGGNKCGKHRLYVRVANALASLGVTVLRFDYRGSGDSDGEFTEMELESQVSDIIAAVRFLQNKPDIDENRIALLGRSLGGAMAVLAAAELKQIKALALWAPVFSASQWKQAWAEAQKSGGSEILDEEYVAFEGQLTNLAFVHQFFAMDLTKVLPKIDHLPFLHFHGGKDAMVNTHHAEMYENQRKEAKGESTFVSLENSDHDFSEVVDQQRLLHDTSRWLVEKLQ